MGKNISSLVPKVNTSLQGDEMREKRKKVLSQKKAEKQSKSSNSLLNLSAGIITATQRLQDIDLILSPSQPETPKDGNCFMHAIIDQLTYDAVWKQANLTIFQLRERVTSSLLNLMYSSDF